MRNFFRNKIDIIKPLSFCLMVSFIILLLTSKCSFLYPFNDWVDANAFFTVGKSMFHGTVPYRDLFEQKGIFLYLIYGIGYLLSNHSFIGVFILEVLFFTVTLYYTFKIVQLFLPKSYAYIIIPLYSALVCTSSSFVQGGSAEEFCFPFLTITLYYFIAHFKGQEVNYKRLFIAGLCAGLILLIKYTLLGLSFAFMAIIFFDYVFSKQIKKGFISCISFLLGMFAPIMVAFVYLLMNHAVDDFIRVYFVINMTSYNIGIHVNVFTKLIRIVIGFLKTNYYNSIVGSIFLLPMPFLLLFLDIKKRGKFALFIMCSLSVFGIYWGLIFFRYYLLPMYIFTLISIIVIFSFLHKHFKLENKKVIIISLLLAICFSWYGANYKENCFTSRDQYFQYRFAEIINKSDEPTLVNMGNLDCGLYTTSGIIPTTYFFELQNFSYDAFPDNLDSFQKYIADKETEFILYCTDVSLDELQEMEKLLFKNYNLVTKEEYVNEHAVHNAYLFQRKVD